MKRKCPPQLRDSIFEFLAGCDDSYIVSFFNLFFSCKQFSVVAEGKLEQQLTSNHLTIYSRFCVDFIAESSSPLSYLAEEVDLENTISPSCLSSYASTVVDLFNRCGKLLKPKCLTYLLRVLFKIMANWRLVSAARAEVHKGYYGLLNKIRLTSFAAISYFVDNFHYEWSKDEIEVLLQVISNRLLRALPACENDFSKGTMNFCCSYSLIRGWRKYRTNACRALIKF